MTGGIRAAITAGIKPTSMLFHEQPNSPWTEADFRLLSAYQLLKDETCSQCGNPVWLCRSEGVQWEVQSDVCNATAATDKWHESHRDKAKDGEAPYALAYVIGFDDDGTPKYDYENLPSRKSYFTKD